MKVKSLSRVQPSVTPWTAAFQALPSVGFSGQEYWSGVPLLSPILQARTLEWVAIAFSKWNITQPQKIMKSSTWVDLENVMISEVSQTKTYTT